jgi:hypothetical protein
MKTNQLTGAALDWAVARCVYGAEKNIPAGFPAFSESWAHGGPIIEGAGMGVFESGCWVAEMQTDNDGNNISIEGATPLIAAMRCYVASKLGDEVEIPEELT